MPTLGANLNQLLQLEQRLATSADRIDRRSDQIERRMDTMIRVFDSQAERTHRILHRAAERIMEDVNRIRFEALNTTDWRGGNQQQFDDAYWQFWRTMNSTTRTVEYYFDRVQQQVTEMTEDLDAFKIEIRQDLQDAALSTRRMSRQIEVQHDRLDQVMNGRFQLRETSRTAR